MSSRTNSTILAVALAFGLGGFAASRWLFAPSPAAPAVVSTDPVAIGERYRDATLPDLDGNPRRFSDWDGRVRLVNYWATWCAPCVREMPMLDQYARAHPDVVVIGIAMDDPAAARAFATRLGIGYPLLSEVPSRTDSSVGFGNTRGVLPYSVLIDASGTVRAAEAGDFADLAELEAFVARSNAR
jgi:peroxiredoxin